jgi:GxxExxY protein
MDTNELTEKIIGAAIEVHKHLGPGLLESAYEECFCYELTLRGINYERQKPMPIEFKEKVLECGYRIDVLVEDLVVVEIKSVQEIIPKFHAQVLTQLKFSKKRVGLLINFNEVKLTDGLKRFVR